jgi:hypothetical protein
MAWKVTTIIFGLTIVVLLAVQLTVPSGSTAIVATSLGVLSAVLVTAVLRFYEISRSAIDMKKLHEDISLLGNKLAALKQLGIYRFAQRSAFGDAYWIEQIQIVARTCSRNTELVLVGRSLENWVNSTFTDLFYDATVKILKSGGSIRMITLDPNGNAGKTYKETTGRDLAVAAKEVEDFLSQRVKPSVTLEQYRRLERKTMSDVQLTFTMFRSDAILWVSPYLSLRDSASNLALSCGIDSPLARAVLNDFYALWQPEPQRRTDELVS